MSVWANLLDRLGRWFPVVLALALPLEFTKQFFPVQLLDASRLVLLLGTVTLSLQVLVLGRSIRVPRQLSFLLLVAFVGLATISWLFTRSPVGLKSTGVLYAYLVLLVLLYNWDRDEAAVRRLWRAIAISGLVVGLAGTSLYWANVSLWSGTHLPRANATFGDPNIYGRFLALTCAGSVVVAAQAESRGWRWLAVASAGATGVAIPFTLSRQGYVLFLLAALTAAVIVRHRRPGLAASGAAIAAFVAMIALFPSTALRASDALEHALSPVVQQTLPDVRRTNLGWADALPIDVERRYLIAAGVQMFADHPVAGLGHGGFEHAMQTTYGAYVRPGYFDVASHTSLVTILAEEGGIGLLLFSLLVVQFVRETFRAARSATGEPRALVLAAALSLALILVASQFEERLFSEPYLWLFLGLFYAVQPGRPLEWARQPARTPRLAVSPSSGCRAPRHDRAANGETRPPGASTRGQPCGH